MPSRSDREFIRLAIEKGLLSREDAKEALIRLGQAEGNKAMLSLDRLLVMEEMLTREQVKDIEAQQHRKVIFCVFHPEDFLSLISLWRSLFE